jgi:hypothetical protein
MKKKENLWELLQRLDEQAGQFNVHLSEANRYFDAAAKKTNSVLIRQEKELHSTIAKVRRAIKRFSAQKEKKATGSDKKGE